MECKYCQGMEPLETKKDFKQYTFIADGAILFTKKKGNHGLEALFMDEINFCPMCGRRFDSDTDCSLSRLIRERNIKLKNPKFQFIKRHIFSKEEP